MIRHAIDAARAVWARFGWNSLGTLLGLAIFVIAAITLFRILRNAEPEKVLAAFAETPWHNIGLAALAVAGAYLTLTCYDYFALRTIGRRDVPYHGAALAAFTSYSIGHNIGATVFTANAIRFRMYAAWNLSVLEIAKMAFVTGLTFWLGNLFVLGAGLTYHPEAATAIVQLPASINRLIGIAMLVMIGCYVAWIALGPRVVGKRDWQVTLPNARLTLVQIGIGVLDLGLSGIALYMLLPPSAEVAFASVLVTFVLSTLLGFASHAPGGLGVFDAAMLVSLQQFETEKLVATVLLFRLLYYITPFALALMALGAREVWNSTKSPTRPPVDQTGPGVDDPGVPPHSGHKER